MSAVRYTMKATAQRTGLSPHVIRMWERRYNAVTPLRTPTGRRLYTDEDIERLRLLRAATLGGHTISHVASLSLDKLMTVVDADRINRSSTSTGQPTYAQSNVAPGLLAHEHLKNCLNAVRNLDATGLEHALTQASVHLGQAVLMDHVLAPLMESISDLWRDGTLRIAHEHLATAVIRIFLGSLTRYADVSPTAPTIICTTPAQQVHEIGALMVAATAASQGWKILYLGASLPADDVVSAVQQTGARALALSIVYPPDDPHLPGELRRLKKHLPAHVTLFVGGRAADNYARVLDEIGAVRIHDMLTLRHKLEALRAAPAPQNFNQPEVQ